MGGKLLLAAGSASVQDNASAQEAASVPYNDGAVASDRPGFGEGAAVVAPGRFQIEAGYAFAWTDTTRRHSLGQVLLRLGLLPRVELRAALNSFVVFTRDPACSLDGEACSRPGAGRSEGFEDLLIGAKVNLVRSNRIGKPALTAIAGLGLPTGDAAFSTDALRPEVRLALDLALSPLVHFSGNGGYTFTPEENGVDVFFTSGALSVALPNVDGLGVFAGIYSLYPRNFEFTHGLEAGITYLPDPYLQLDLNAGLGWKGDGPDLVFGLGLARRF